MTQVFEFAAFTVREGHQQALQDERPAMIAAMRRAFPGLVSAWLTQRDDGSWLDAILWRSREDAEHSAAHARCLKVAVQPPGTGSTVRKGTHPSLPAALRTLAQPLGSSRSIKVSSSPAVVASSVVS